MPRQQLDFNLAEIGDLATALDNYKFLAISFTQLDPKQRDSLTKFWNESIVKRTDKTWLTTTEERMWCDIDVRVFKQTWSNTSGGWEGIGGAAFTSAYTTIIENLNFRFACIYYGNRLAYICKIDEAYRSMDKMLPGVHSCSKSGLDIIYKRSV